MLWVKALHIIFVVSWFAGLFYLPRLFVNHAMVDDAATRQRLTMMEHKLLRFMTPLAVLAIAFGIWLWSYYGFADGDGWRWMHAKLTLVGLLAGYHGWCWKIYRDFANGQNRHSHVWYRVFNEVPVLALFAIVILVVVKPF
ncbi:putative membrane protein [Andreprevotia lacus DSM 23236]|jgi:putative membrane protein|uniref:Protoporphyrinogen IX oxidase n=2 Tax=Andreprevotia TaxID=397275 RepID=A0A1W1XB15_9NEIS|nr:CopD family protein [Andreprevotia lacus]SMC21112.1 putative membrane protein [Andreprevotia lacus DSM 23236]